MPWTRRQVRYLESSGSPLTPAQKDKMNAELHADPSLGHHKKGSAAMKQKAPFHHTMITHHDDGSHTVEHHPHPKPSKSPAFMEREDADSYSAGTGAEMIDKLEEKLKIKRHGKDGGGQDEPPEPIERADGDEE